MPTTPLPQRARAARLARTLGFLLALSGVSLAAAQVPLQTLQVAGTNVNTNLRRALETEDGGAVVELVTNDDAPRTGWFHELVKLSGEGRELWRYRVPRSYDDGVVDFAVVGDETTVLLTYPDTGNTRLDSASLLTLNRGGEAVRSTRLDLPDSVAFINQPTLTKLPGGWALNAALVGEPSWYGPSYTLGFRESGERFAAVSTATAADPDARRITALARLGDDHLLRYDWDAVDVLRADDLEVVRSYSAGELGVEMVNELGGAASVGDTTWLAGTRGCCGGDSDFPVLLGFTGGGRGVERRTGPEELRGKQISGLKAYGSGSVLLEGREYVYEDFGSTTRTTYYLTDTRLRSLRRLAGGEDVAYQSTALRLGAGEGKFYTIEPTTAYGSRNQLVRLSELATGKEVLRFGREGGLEPGPFTAALPLGGGVLLREAHGPRVFYLSEDTPLRAVDSFSVSEGSTYKPTVQLSLKRPSGGAVLAYELRAPGGSVTSHLRILDVKGRLRRDISLDGELGYLGRDERYGGDGFIAVVQEKGDSYRYEKSTLIRYDALGGETGRRVIPEKAYYGYSVRGAHERPDGTLYLDVIDWDVFYDATVDAENRVVDFQDSGRGESYFPRGPISAAGVDAQSPWWLSGSGDTLDFYAVDRAPAERLNSLVVPEGYGSRAYRWDAETLLGKFSLDSAGMSYGAILAFDYATGSVTRTAVTEALPRYTPVDYGEPGLSYETQVFSFTLGVAAGINRIAVAWGEDEGYTNATTAPVPARVGIVGSNVVTDEVRFTSTVDLAHGVSLISVDGRRVYRLSPESVSDGDEAIYRAALPALVPGAYVLRIGRAGAVVLRAGR